MVKQWVEKKRKEHQEKIALKREDEKRQKKITRRIQQMSYGDALDD